MHSLYTPEILKLSEEIPFLGRLSAPHGSACKRSPVCGSSIIVDVTLDTVGRICGIGQVVNACTLGKASAAVMANFAMGRSQSELIQARCDIAEFLEGTSDGSGAAFEVSLFQVARTKYARRGSILLPFEAVVDAVSSALKDRQH